MSTHRVTNMGSQVQWFDWNGKMYIWGPHPKHNAGHFEVKLQKSVRLNEKGEPAHIRHLLEDGAVVLTPAYKREFVITKVDKPGNMPNFLDVPELLYKELNLTVNRQKNPETHSSSKDFVFDEKVIETALADAAAAQTRLAEVEMRIAEKERKLLEMQAQIEAAELEEKNRKIQASQIALEQLSGTVGKGKK